LAGFLDPKQSIESRQAAVIIIEILLLQRRDVSAALDKAIPNVPKLGSLQNVAAPHPSTNLNA